MEAEEDINNFANEVANEISIAMPGFTKDEVNQMYLIVLHKMSNEGWQRSG